MIYYKHKTTDNIKIKKLPWYKLYETIYKYNNWYWVNDGLLFSRENDIKNLTVQQQCGDTLKDVALIAKDDIFLYFYHDYEFGKIEIDRIEYLDLYDLHSHLNVCKTKEGIDNDIKIFLHYFMVNDLPLETHFSFEGLKIKDTRDNLLPYKFPPKLLYHQCKIINYCDKFINLHLLHDENNTKLTKPVELFLPLVKFHRYGFYKTFNVEYKGI